MLPMALRLGPVAVYTYPLAAFGVAALCALIGRRRART
jgi:hypothetical protein